MLLKKCVEKEKEFIFKGVDIHTDEDKIVYELRKDKKEVLDIVRKRLSQYAS